LSEGLKSCVLRIEGTNMAEEVAAAASASGLNAEIVHLKQLEPNCPSSLQRRLEDYHMLILPGGFSSGDYVRAGAIFASRIRSSLGNELLRFIDEGKLVLGICNGFQVLVELGLLPAGGERAEFMPRAALATNMSGRYECRPALLKNVNRGSCIFTRKIGYNAIVSMPTAHTEGRLLFQPSKEREWIERLEETDGIVFRYCDSEGEFLGYPWNPSGTTLGIAALTNEAGNVLGMMPHPERAYWRYLTHTWTRTGRPEEKADGSLLFDAAYEYLASRF
jgi:phosphoribosylformylglycinamidine synthase I